MKSKNQKGFSLIEGLLLLIALTLIGFVGFYVWHAQKQTEKTLTSVDNTSNKSSTTRSAAKTTSADSFAFKELGVKILLSSDLKGLNYHADPQFPTLYNVTTTDFEANDQTCAGSFAQLARGDGMFKESQNGDLLKQFNGFYIDANIPNCVGESPTATKLLNALELAFKNAETLN
jgi:hypothetical protein